MASSFSRLASTPRTSSRGERCDVRRGRAFGRVVLQHLVGIVGRRLELEEHPERQLARLVPLARSGFGGLRP